MAWNVIVARMCDTLRIPDLSTRHGFKNIHARFNEIYKRLDAAYVSARGRGHEQVMGGVVGIMAKVCSGTKLRDRLFDKGLLKKVMPFLELDSARHVALQALTMVTHHGGLPARQEIACHNKTLVKLMQDHQDDPKVAELVIITIAYATESVVACEETPDPKLLKETAIRTVLQATDCDAVPSMLRLLAAFTWSSNITTRSIAFSGLLRHTILESVFEQAAFDPRGIPSHLSSILMDYGLQNAEVTLTLSSMALQDRDIIIQRTEFAVAEGEWRTDGPEGRETANISGMPFTRWTDALPLSAKALRAKGTPADLDRQTGRLDEAIALGHAVLKRNRQLVYAYYIISMGADVDDGLRAVKKGLECKNVTLFVRNQLLWRAVNHVAQRDAREGDMEARAQGTAYLMSTWEDTKTYVSEAPLEDWRELNPARRRLETQINMTRDLVLGMYTEGVKEWSAFVKHFDECSWDGLAGWLEGIDLDESDDEHSGDPHSHGQGNGHACRGTRANSETKSSELYRCSWCGKTIQCCVVGGSCIRYRRHTDRRL
ncbi:hypothetical protein BD413DRAFT_604711 [Trametes elegans]|nr:hypothetical protein BD413DRAFT_604711 [Trametes elegans]